ncbi:hypothetical protein [Mycobacterium sp. URHB0044]|jgi:hypothetical protein|uniref:hypothetical protein n=1 Tax=Mycobacterium sp. URHB0044 TaxID=1380386 RepID=UPI0005653E9C|nr:hypothetical protein [Mycobacterium sp. URHB0044]
MLSRHQHHDDRLIPFEDSVSAEPDVRAPLLVRLRTRLFAYRYDREIEDGISPVPGSPLAVHGARLVSPQERDDLAGALRTIVRDADVIRGPFTSRIPVHSAAVHHAAPVIDEVCDRLTDPFPVHARGMARLRIVLSDGCGPLYRSDTGTLAAALRGVLATL